MDACCCCFDDDEDIRFVTCDNNHIICENCIDNGIKNAIGDLKYFRCPHQSKCGDVISNEQITSMIDENLLEAYLEMIDHITTKNIPNLHKCENCNYAVVVEAGEYIFHCVLCAVNYCITCKKLEHPNKPCNEKIYSEAERLTELAIIRCVCGLAIMRDTACNHLFCQCGVEWCWWCKRRGRHGEPCKMYGDPPMLAPAITTTGINIAVLLAQEPHEIARREEDIRVEKIRLELERLGGEKERLEIIKIELDRTERNRLCIDLEHAENIQMECELIETKRIETKRLKRISDEISSINSLNAQMEKIQRIQNKIINLESLYKSVVLPPLYPASKGFKTQNDFNIACINGNCAIVKRMLKLPEINLNEGIFNAINYNRIDIIELLLVKSDCFVDAKITYKFIKQAIKQDCSKIVKLFLGDPRVAATSSDINKLLECTTVHNRELPALYLHEKYEMLKI